MYAMSLEYNRLTGAIPPELTGMKRLEGLWLNGNSFEGCIPHTLHGSRDDLHMLGMPACPGWEKWGQCFYGGAIDKAVDNPGLVHDCSVLLEVKDKLGADAALNWSEALALDHWEGVTVEQRRGRQRVTELRLDNKGLAGPVPRALSALNGLEGLWLHENRFGGGIPVEISRLSELEWLWLAGNQLTGEIPAELGKLGRLKGLGLQENLLTGSIPTALSALSELQWLRLDYNGLAGNIPAWLGDLAELEGLGLHWNALTGEIPAELGRLKRLKWLRLDGNRLTGFISAALGGLSRLEGLGLTGEPAYGRHSGGAGWSRQFGMAASVRQRVDGGDSG